MKCIHKQIDVTNEYNFTISILCNFGLLLKHVYMTFLKMPVGKIGNWFIRYVDIYLKNVYFYNILTFLICSDQMMIYFVKCWSIGDRVISLSGNNFP